MMIRFLGRLLCDQAGSGMTKDTHLTVGENPPPHNDIAPQSQVEIESWRLRVRIRYRLSLTQSFRGSQRYGYRRAYAR